MSSTCSSGEGPFSGLRVGWRGCDRGALLKKEVMGLYMGFGFLGDLAGGGFEVDGTEALDEPACRVWVREAFASPRAPSARLKSAPPLGFRRGGVCDPSWSVSSEESTIGCFRAALGLPMPPRVE
jgi:hypothetical protein